MAGAASSPASSTSTPPTAVTLAAPPWGGNPHPLFPGDFEDVSLVITNASVGDVWVVADGAGAYDFSSFDVPGAPLPETVIPNLRWMIPLMLDDEVVRKGYAVQVVSCTP